jgi:hypothetical protein
MEPQLGSGECVRKCRPNSGDSAHFGRSGSFAGQWAENAARILAALRTVLGCGRL